MLLGSIDASIHVPATTLHQLLRANHCILMEDLLSNDFELSAIKKTNLFRLFLQVQSLAEIRNPTGNCILESVWKGERPHSKVSLFGHDRLDHAVPCGRFGVAFLGSFACTLKSRQPKLMKQPIAPERIVGSLDQ